MRSDRDHRASRVAVEQEEEERRGDEERRGGEERGGEEERRRGGGEEEQATDIKSNNPHLAGGEKTSKKQNAKDVLFPHRDSFCDVHLDHTKTTANTSPNLCHHCHP